MNRFPLVFLLALLIPLQLNAMVPVERTGVIKEAEIVAVSGEGNVRFLREPEWRIAVREQLLTAGDAVKTGVSGRMALLFSDGAQIKVHHRTTIQIKSVGKAASGTPTVLDLEQGEIWSRAPSSPDSLRIKTPSATAAIRGTDWVLRVDEQGTSYLTVLKGTIEFYNDFGAVSIGPQEQALAEVGKAPVKTFLVRPKDRVQWIISYPIAVADLVAFRNHRRPAVLDAISAAAGRATTPAAKLFLAELLYDAKQRAECAQLVEQILTAEPASNRARLLKGYLHLGMSETEDAQKIFRSVLAQSSGQDTVLAALGVAGVYLQNNRVEEAGHLLQSLDKDRSFAEVGVVLAHFLAYQGSFAEAMAVCADYGERFPDDERFPVLSADLALTVDEQDRAQTAAQAALRINPDSSPARTILGRYQYLQGLSKEAESTLRQAIATDPVNTLARSELGKLLMERGHFEESLRQFDSAIATDPNIASYRSRRGMLMNWIEEMAAARSDLQKAVAMNATDYQSLNALGIIALKEGRTDEAVDLFLRSGLLEPNYAEPHVYLAIAYYQLDQLSRAFDELSVAKNLDPKDPVPHIISYIIHQDTYRPMDAVREAAIALALLPNLKSVNPVQDIKRGISNLGNALLGLGMGEWAGSYAEQSFDLFDAASYRFVSNRFTDNPVIFQSANYQSFLLNPMSIGFDTRYQDIVLRPQHNFHLGTRLGSEEGSFAGTYSLIQEGFVRQPFEINYLLQLDLHDSEGFRENAGAQGYFVTFGLGGRPDFRNGFFIFGHVAGDEKGDPGSKTAPDHNDYTKLSSYSLNAGYNRRLGPKNHLLINAYASNLESDFHNPDPLGSSAGITDLAASFIKGLGLERGRQIFRDGLYEVDFGAPWYATDSTGLLADVFPALFAEIPENLDTKLTRRSATDFTSTGLQLKHLVEVSDDHQLSLGAEWLRHSIESKRTESMTQEDLPYPPFDLPMIAFTDEFFSDADITPILYYAPRKSSSRSLWLHGDTLMVYIDDRWKVTDHFLVEAGLFFESYEDEFNDRSRLNPRIGVAWEFLPQQILRTAYQRRLIPADPTFAPFTTAGVGFAYPQMQLFPGATLEDYAMSLESLWTPRFFTQLSYERRDITIPQFSSLMADYDNRADIFSVAANLIVTDQIGVYARYRYNNNRNLNGVFRYGSSSDDLDFAVRYKGKEMPFEPETSFGAGAVWVLPAYMKFALSTRYVSEQYGDALNADGQIPAYWTTDVNFTWEPFNKHLLVSFDVLNLFDVSYETDLDIPGMGRSCYLTLEYRF